MLGSVLPGLLSVSLTASAMILGIRLLAPVLNRRYTAKWKYWIWLALALRLLLPLNVSLPQAPVVLAVPNARIVLPVAARDVPTPTAMQMPQAPVEDVEGAKTEQAQGQGISLFNAAGAVWLIGFALLLLWRWASYRAYRKSVVRWSRPVRSDRILRQYAALRAQMRIRAPIRLLVCEKVQSPQMIGYISPLLLLPNEDHAERDAAYILRHELAHFARHDLWYKLLLTLANAVHWFNPLVYLMVREACADLELSCDDIVMAGAGFDERKAYSETILASVHGSCREATLLTTNFRGGVNTMKHRFENILTLRRRHGFAPLAFAMAVLLAASLLVGGDPGMAQQEDANFQQASTAIMVEEASDSRVSNAELYAPYAPYGLSYNETDGRLYYRGQLVRYFEDMYPIGAYNAQSGMLSQHVDGTVDVHGVRDLSDIKRNPDGSFDPSGVLIGVEPYTQAEFDRRTQELAKPQPGGGQAVSVVEDVANGGIAQPQAGRYQATQTEWWTHGEYAAWLDEQRVELPKIIGERGWNAQDGWFVWSQQRVDEALARYEQILSEIEKGALVSKRADGDDSVMMIGNAENSTFASNSDTTYALNAPISASEVSVVADNTIVQQGTASVGTPPLSEYSRQAWKLNYSELVKTAMAWEGRVFLCSGSIVEILPGDPQQLVMDVCEDGGEAQLVILENRSAMDVQVVGRKYNAYAELEGYELYDGERLPKLIARYMLDE